jgi:hypothetical protein
MKMFRLSPFLLLLLPALSFAQDAPASPQGFDLVKTIVEAAKGGKWGLFASLVIMLLVWGATKTPLLKKWLKGPTKIWVAAVAGVLSAFATNVFVGAQAGQIDWFAAVSSGLSVGLAAGGLWSLVGRKILKQPIDADGDGELDPESTFQDDPEPEEADDSE